MTLSEYELQRLRNIKTNAAKLLALGLDNPIKLDRAPPRTVKGGATNRKAKPERRTPPVRLRSLRARNLDSDGHPLPDRDVKPAAPMPEPRKVRKPSTPLDAAKVSTGATSAADAAAFLARLDTETAPLLASSSRVAAPKAKKQKNGKLPPPPPIDPLALGVADEDVAKLVVDRIFSIAVHPSDTKLLVAAGDTWGRVGLWDVNAADDAPVATFEPHSRPVGGLRVLCTMPHLLLSCSHDGAVRALDLSGGAAASFAEVYRVAEDADGDYPSLHGLSRTAGEGGGPAVCDSDGGVAFLDLRAWGAASPRFALHEKKVYSVDFAPTRPWLLATASLDRTVRLWDCRALSSTKAKSKPVAELPHGLAVQAAVFSPSGSRLLTTSNDDFLRVYGDDDAGWAASGSKLATECVAIRHNNKTGRFLTPFQPEWVRGSNDMFVSGSLDFPRGLDVLRADGSAVGRLIDDNVNSVLSVLAWHPTKPVLAASNASGKVFLWR